MPEGGPAVTTPEGGPAVTTPEGGLAAVAPRGGAGGPHHAALADALAELDAQDGAWLRWVAQAAKGATEAGAVSAEIRARGKEAAGGSEGVRRVRRVMDLLKAQRTDAVALVNAAFQVRVPFEGGTGHLGGRGVSFFNWAVRAG